MQLTSAEFVPATQQKVWGALNDPQILKACIPGCESIEAVSAEELHVVMSAKIGPIAARFKGKLLLLNVEPPNSYSLKFEGQGGVAGFAKGEADVRLTPIKDGTNLSYTATAQVGGKLAQIGSRLVDVAAKKTAGEFFSAFGALVGEAPAEQVSDGGSGESSSPSKEQSGHEAKWKLVVLGLIMAAIGALFAVLWG